MDLKILKLQLMNKLLTILLFSFFLLNNNLSANPNIVAKTAILVDFDSDEILYELEPDMQIYPASMTKIMTSIIVFDLLKNNKISLDDKFIVSEKAWRLSQSGYSSMFIMVNDEVSVEDLLKGIIIASGNDACVAIAEGIAGTEENFADMMNEKAGEIGMLNSNFTNSSGINDPDNYSTVRDIAIMSKHLIKNYPDLYKMYAEKEFTWDKTGGDPITQGNRNGLLYRNIGADGIKTGYLAVEKYSLASTIKRDTRRLISVGSGFQTKGSRTSESIKLLSWGFRNTDTFQISKMGETKFNLETWIGKKKSVEGITKEDLFITLKKKDVRNFKVFLDYTGPIIAPIKQGQEIGKIKIFKGEELLKTAKVFASEDIKKINFFKSVLTSINYMIWGDV
ncbi:MAG: D-alanyl-D-alanine carboxypeptidase [Pelagibacterales bacterium MED-G40]|nr:MAG: D-alanyl-D-alanine carboxypeptidase [Pelagibacterales bacterium MED-G40]